MKLVKRSVLKRSRNPICEIFDIMYKFDLLEDDTCKLMKLRESLRDQNLGIARIRPVTPF